MKYKVLISAPYFIPVLERFKARFEKNDIEMIVADVNERLEEDDLLHYAADIHGVICGDDRFTERVLSQAKKLKVISKWGTGIDSIDQEACRTYGVKLCNTPNAFTEPVADSVMGYILSFARKIPWMDQDMKNRIWSKERQKGVSLNELTLGIIGVGNIGRAVVKRALAFNMTILGNDIQKPERDFIENTGITMVSKEHIFEQCDFISLNCDLNATSRHLLNKESFEKIKRKPVIINTARGPLLEESALIRALERGLISGAALDVFEDEPLSDDSPFLAMDNVLLAPHNANNSPSAWDKVHENTVKNLIKGLMTK